MSDIFNVETPQNYEQKCCCALVLDVSGSMGGEPIDQLNAGIQAFYNDIQSDLTSANRLEIAVIEFSDTVSTLITPSLVSSFTMPVLSVKGTTRLVDGVREAIQIVDDRKAFYKSTGQPYYRPWVVLITDGAPDSGQDVDGLASEIKERTAKKALHFFAIGVKGADMDLLTRISDPSMAPAQLQGLKFAQFFRWLSASMSTIANSKEGDKVTFPDPRNWMVGFTV